MRVLAIGDIHGCFLALETVLEAASITSKDFIIFLGDYIDRGPKSKEAVAEVIRRTKGGRGIALRGNHEEMILSARRSAQEFHGWRACGGEETLTSYGADLQEDWRICVPKDHWEFFEATRPWFETHTHIFVHGSVVPTLEMNEQPEYILYWELFSPRLQHKSGKTLVCGHTAQGSGWPAQGRRAVCIDTGAYFGEWLTCLDVASGEFWQANELCAVRTGKLNPAEE